MRKIIRIGFPILCVAVIGGTFILLNKTAERINKNSLKEKDTYENIAENPSTNNAVIYETKTEIENTVSNVEEAKTQEIKNKARAIEIVKQLAPPMTNCFYTNEGMIGEEYLVAIRDNDTKNVKIYYSVNIQKEKIQIYSK